MSAHDGAPFIFQVPATIGMAYFDYGYLAWCLASVLVGAGAMADAAPGSGTTIPQPTTRTGAPSSQRRMSSTASR